MSPNSAKIIPLQDRHVAGACELSARAGWNQTATDWRMMMAQGRAIGVEDEQGQVVGTTISLPYGNRIGWISMVLVSPAAQGAGLASRLVARASQDLEADGLIAGIDATPEGEAVYRRLGFEPCMGLQRWEHGAVETLPLANGHDTRLEPINLDGVCRRDRDVFGGKRDGVLENLAQRSSGFACQDASGNGFLLGRDGRTASQIGPVSSATVPCALKLLDHALAKISGRVFVDAFDHQTQFCARLEEYGFKPQRPFLRMLKGRGEPFGKLAQMFAAAGPELG